MIKITRISTPTQLTDEVKAQLTEQFKKNPKKAVWNKSYIRDNLLKMSQSKCCYCEEIIGEGCSEMHIDHYHDKDTYPDEVVEWNNLLPSCSHCNKKKSTHDTYAEPIIDPTLNDPREIFYIKNYRYYSYDCNPSSLGKLSIGVLGINDSEEKVKWRYTIGDELCSKLDRLYEDAIELGDNILTNTRKRNRILNGCENSLKLCTRASRFGASMATVLQESEDYQAIRGLLKKYGLWDNQLEQLHNESLEICLSKKET